MALSAGDKLGPYEIVEAIGAGGMGAVYRARDTRLGRDVAIKVSDQKFGERFEREARVISSLNHPNICTLYDVGDNYLVMELVEGQTLADRIKQGAIPLDEALAIAHQIADALEAAHEKGITHRDLKPGNVMVKEDGTIKVLDFGLAKVGPRTSAGDSGNPELSPTISMAATQAGVILGTAAYMAPEQARGKVVDKRADIWAFGVVLYEMVTGKKLFAGEDLTDTLASVVKVDPDLSQAPQQLRRMLGKCLEKDPRKRLRDIGDAWGFLDDGRTGDTQQVQDPPRKQWLWPAVAGVLAVGVAVALWAPWRVAPEEPSLRLNVSLPPDTSPTALKLSPDGTRVLASVVNTIQIRRLEDSSAWEELVDDTRGPFWSADGRFIGFFTYDGKLRKIPAAGGPIRDLCSGTGTSSGGDWNADGVILFTNAAGQLRRVDEDGGTCEPVWKDDPNVRFGDPTFLPDGNHFLYARFNPGDPAVGGVYMAALDDPEAHRVLAERSSTVYVPAGGDGLAYVLFRRNIALMAQPFDEDRLEPVGDPFEIAPQVATTFNGEIAASFANGTFVYMTGREQASQLTWFNRAGKQLGTVGPLVEQSEVRLSPDGTAAMTMRREGGGGVTWIYDLERGSDGRLLPAGTSNAPMAWFPQGRRVLFGKQDPEGPSMYEKDIDGGEDPRLIARSSVGDLTADAADFSPDGQYLLFTERNPKTGADISFVRWSESPGYSKRETFLATSLGEGQARVSPDGRWIAYALPGGPNSEVFLRPFPSGAGLWRAGTGQQPQWSRDGKTLYFVKSADASANILFEVSIEADGKGGVRVGTPQELFRFRANGYVITANAPAYALHPDGERFLVNLLPEAAPTLIHAVTNFRNSAMLRR